MFVLGFYRGYKLRKTTNEFRARRNDSEAQGEDIEDEEVDEADEADEADETITVTSEFLLAALCIPLFILPVLSGIYAYDPTWVTGLSLSTLVVLPLISFLYAMSIFYANEINRWTHTSFVVPFYGGCLCLLVGDFKDHRIRFWWALLLTALCVTCLYLLVCRIRKNSLELLAPSQLNKAILNIGQTIGKSCLVVLYFTFKGERYIRERGDQLGHGEYCYNLVFANLVIMVIIYCFNAVVAIQAMIPESIKSGYTITFENLAKFDVHLRDVVQVFFGLIAAVMGMWLFAAHKLPGDNGILEFFAMFSGGAVFAIECKKVLASFSAVREINRTVERGISASGEESSSQIIVEEVSRWKGGVVVLGHKLNHLSLDDR